jgi:hypothetical protein
MASSVVSDLDAQVRPLLSHIKVLTNDRLKDLCRAEHLPVSGVKATLQSRIIDRKSSAYV